MMAWAVPEDNVAIMRPFTDAATAQRIAGLPDYGDIRTVERVNYLLIQQSSGAEAGASGHVQRVAVFGPEFGIDYGFAEADNEPYFFI